MQVLVVLVSRHKLALKSFETHGADLFDKGRLPPAIAGKASLLARAFDPDKANGLAFEDFVLRGGEYGGAANRLGVDGVIVLYEAPLRYLLDGVRDAVFAAEVPQIGYLENVRNFLAGKFSALLGNYGLLVEMLQNATKYQAASLPLRNFDADEFRKLLEICRTAALEKTFGNDIVPGLNRLLKLRGPKRRSSYPHVYFKDDSDRYFGYGHERHSRFETGEPHGTACMVNGQFRFGTPLDQERHFNVTVGDSDARARISCILPNCHGETVVVKDRSHINMFSNDFHK